MGFNIQNSRACKVRRATDQTIVTATATAVSFSTAVFNPNAMAEFVTNPTRITITKAGLYHFNAGVVWAAGSTGVRTLQFKRTGVAGTFFGQVNAAAPATGTGIQSLDSIFGCDVADYVELIATHTQGSDLAITADTTAHSPYMAAVLIAPTYSPNASAENF